MSRNEDLDLAAELREEGNTLYKKSAIAQAIKKYRKAAEISPGDARIISNLSAAYFELGDYESSSEYADQALELLLLQEEKTPTTEARLNALTNRLERCQQYRRPVEKDSWLKHKLTLVPRCRPSMSEFPPSPVGEVDTDSRALNYEYFAFGHDFIESLYDHHINRYAKDDEQISFFFAGIGDARNLFGTLMEIVQFERERPTAPKRRFHFTINDIKPTPIARDLIMIMLFQDLADLEDSNDHKPSTAAIIITTLYYVFHGPIMPKVAFNQLQLVIGRLIKSFEADRQPLRWVYLRREDIDGVVTNLKNWEKKVLGMYNVAAIIDRVIHSAGPKGYSSVPNHIKTEETIYNLTGVLFPSRFILEEYEPQLKKLIAEAERGKPKSVAKKITKLVKDKWCINPTMVDVDWLDAAYGVELDLGHDPFGSIDRFYDSGIIDATKRARDGCLHDVVSAFFTETTQGLRKLKGRIFIEAVVGDFAMALEQIKLGTLDRDGDVADKHEFPYLYDRIHISNIPDYVGGHMTSFLYCSPVLKPVASSWITACCLKNSSSWKDVEEYNAEYLMIPDTDRLERLLQVRLLSRGPPGSFMPLAEYHKFGVLDAKPWPHSSLLKREEFKKWMYGMFFKFAIPYYRDSFNQIAEILSPLNLTILFRLWSRLHQVGYPLHWIIEIITNILTDNVETTTRPPRSQPVKPADVLESHASAKLSTAPFVAEMAVNCALFQPLIPFKLEHELIPPIMSLYTYTFDLRDSELFLRPDIFNLVLVFWDHEALLTASGGGPPADLRPLLDPSSGELDAKWKRPAVQNWRERGVAVWSTFEWDGRRKVATVVMDEEFVNMCKRQKWWVGLWRTDFWCKAFKLPVEVRFCCTKGPRWVDEWQR